MICLECVNGLRRDMPGKTEVVCCLDSRLVMAVIKCNFFFRAVDDRPIVESVLPEIKFHMPEEVKEEFYGKSLVEDVNEYMQKEQQGVAEKVAFEQDRMTVNALMNSKRGRGRPRKT